jgi:hypothetical protein
MQMEAGLRTKITRKYARNATMIFISRSNKVGETQMVSKEEGQNLVPIVWRDVFVRINECLVFKDFNLSHAPEFVGRLDDERALLIKESVESYVDKLVLLPEETWASSVCQWEGGWWAVLVDLYTENQAPSDLVLSARIYEDRDFFRFQVEAVYVP